jgi:LysR family transcriptional regulator, glycine cleavage system transcriptional activator
MRWTGGMAPRPPSLRAIAAFEAAARHQSFTKAAEELNLTQSAISHAIRGLEERLATPLFTRYGRTVALTEHGRVFVGRVRVSLSVISEAFEEAPRQDRPRLTLSLEPGFADRFLAPRLARFSSLKPEIQLDLRQNAGLDELRSGDLDLAVRFGTGGWAGLTAQVLSREVLLPVARPGLAPAAARPEDLLQLPLIHTGELAWRVWLEEAGLGERTAPVAIAVDDVSLALRLAAEGMGVALAPRLLVDSEIRAGRLMRMCAADPSPREVYHALWNPASPRAAAIRAFLDWLIEEMDAATHARPTLHAAE